MSAIIMKFREGKPVEIKAEGIPGESCKQITAPFEKIIGGKLISDTPTNEATLPPVTTDTAVKAEY